MARHIQGKLRECSCGGYNKTAATLDGLPGEISGGGGGGGGSACNSGSRELCTLIMFMPKWFGCSHCTHLALVRLCSFARKTNQRQQPEMSYYVCTGINGKVRIERNAPRMAFHYGNFARTTRTRLKYVPLDTTGSSRRSSKFIYLNSLEN